ncbi:autotransporter outer membrane beta-barrel domain-containing protein [Phascolarctobacterium succinatutens]|uniref:autotransporter outer membrane beta-barrel domain-containing protein n=1 Tax=Phascolarctobacterium succinatutens TaxID=626940 RepID=UPI00201B7702|nr:autotransporter outer membrane beta-barrel domain-containing protein [Phascolarctobacterium succinatutens]UQT41886.1 autotransporter outer membrane beta-barrel domain-containing protein [Phascolarctobacterium succinatutens]
MAVLMTLGGFTFGTNPTFAETNDKPVWVGSYNAGAYKDGIFVSNADTTDNLVHIGADVQTKVVNVTDSVTSNNKAVYVGAYDKLVANEGVNISNINSHDTTSTGEKHGLYVFGATVEAPTIRVDNLTTDSTEALAGLVAGTDVGYGMNKETLKADSIYVGNVKSDTSKYVYGSLLQGALWQSFHEGQDNNLTIENITGGADNAIVGGIEVQFANSTMSDCSYDITGDTVISNINSTQGSAYGIMAKGSSTGSEAAYMHLNNLKISDIHGKDLSVGICGHVGDIIVDNADINMTGKDGYNGLYAEPVADAENAAVNSFAISGSLVGNIKLDNAEGSYNIQGDILADRFNLDKQVEVAIKQLEDPKTLEQLKEQLKEGHPDWTDEQVDDFINNQVADLVNTLKNSGHINLGGKLALYGDVYAKCGGNVNINLTKDSIFEGQADNYADCDTFCSIVWRKADLDGLNKSDLYKLFGFDSMQEQLEMQGLPIVGAGKIDISMKDDSIWKAHGKSFVDTLNFKDGGLVDMHAEDGSSITAGKVTGNGTFIMNLSNNADKSDMLYVKDFSEAGVQTIQANLKDGLKAEDLKGMRFATTGGDDYKRNPNEKFKVVLYKNQGVNDVTYKVSNEAFNVKNEKFDPEATETNEKFNGGKDGTGTYKPGNDYITAIFSGKEYTRQVPDYEKSMLAQLKGDNPYDDDNNVRPEYMKTEIIENPIKEGTNWYLDTAVNNTSNSGNIIKNAAALDYANAVTTDTLNKRLGEARYSNEGDGMWARVRHDRFGKTNRYEGKNTMTELGYDWKRCDTSYGKHMQGAAVNYTTGSADYKGVTGESSTKRYGLSFYDTQLRETGHYLDTVAKFGRVSNKFTLEQEDENNVNADYHNNYYALSFEYGRKNPLENNWYVEPQAQLQYTYLASTDYRTSQSTDVQLSGTDSLIGRVGFRIGRELDDKTAFYVDANAYHEFLGNQDILASDRTGIMNATTHNDGIWYEAGVGISGKLNKNTNGFVQFTKGFGSDVEHTWSFEGGLNFTF